MKYINQTPEQIRQTFQDIDLNRDGEITQIEFIKVFIHLVQSHTVAEDRGATLERMGISEGNTAEIALWVPAGTQEKRRYCGRPPCLDMLRQNIASPPLAARFLACPSVFEA